MGLIVYNGISSRDYHIQVEHPPGYETPERDYEIIHVPGRNGDLVIDTGAYKNVSRIYEIAVGSYFRHFTPMVNGVAEWLHSASGYARLEDTYEPEYYRLAMYEEATNIENILNQAGRATISFNCKPQRFLKSGDRTIEISNPATLYNPTKYVALPIITVKGTGGGTLTVGDYTVTISDMESFVVIDSEMQDAYMGETNMNPYVTLDNGFPKLIAGENKISYTGGITAVEVIPKWWTL